MTDQALDPPAARPADGGTAPVLVPDVRTPPAHGADTGAAPAVPRFVGREREAAGLREEINRPGLGASRGKAPERARVLLVVGRPGIGRTAMALHLADRLAPDYPDGRYFFRLTGDGGEPVPAARTVRDLLRAVTAHGSGPAALPGTAAAVRDPARDPDPAAPGASDGEATHGRPAAPGTEAGTGGGAERGPDSGPASGPESGPASGSDSSPASGPGNGSENGPGQPPATGAPAPRIDGEADDAAALRAALAGRRVLLVLDDVASAGQLAGVLPEEAGSLVVATSGGPLSGVPDVRPCTLGGLDTPAAVALLGQAVGGTRVTNDPRGAEALVQEAAGHPTALRLVGAWLAARPRLSLSEAASRLRATRDTVLPAARAVDGLAPPEPAAEPAAEQPEPDAARTGSAPAAPATPPAPTAGGPPDGTDRTAAAPKLPAAASAPAPAGGSAGTGAAPSATPHELGRAFRLVYEDLPATAARMLRLLVLAPAGMVDAQTASALAGCSVPAALSTLDDFVADGLLTTGPADGRYRVPGCLEPLLRDLVRTRDRPEDVRLARARMLERTVRLLLSCRAALLGEAPADGLPKTLRFGSPTAAAGWLDTRLPALMSAARIAVADGELDTLARRLVAALVRALVAAPTAAPAIAERYELHRLVLDVAERRGLHRERAAALINLADLDAEAGRHEDAVERYREALAAARAADDTEAEGRVLEALGCGYLARQDLPRASDWFGRALALRQARGELGHQARLHARIGSVLTYLGRYGPALREWRAAAGVYRRLGDLASQARALAEAARVQEYAGHPEDALRTCRDALYWARQAKERRLEAAVLLRLADALDRLGDSGGAGLQRTAARRLFRPGESPAF